MPRNGSGTYSRAVAPYQNGTTADAPTVNTEMNDIASALTQSLSKDGQTTPTADLPMGGNNHTGVGDAISRNQYAAAGQVQDGVFSWGGTAGGTANAITLAPVIAITTYTAGQAFDFIAANDNSGATTIAVSGLTTKAAQNIGAAMVGGEILTGKLYRAMYDGTAFQVFRLSLTPAMPFVDTTPIVKGSADGTKQVRLEPDTNVPTATTIVLTTPGASGTLATGADAQGLFLPRSYLAGLQLTYSSGTTLAVAAGQCRDSTNAANITVSALTACAITASTVWAAGSSQNKLNNQALPAAGTLHVFAMRKDSDGSGDIIIDASLTPTLPSGYTYYRRIASLRTSSSAWIQWNQFGDMFQWENLQNDSSGFASVSTAAANYTVTVPSGIKVVWLGQVFVGGASGNQIGVRVYDPDLADAAMNAGSNAIGTSGLVASGASPVRIVSDHQVPTNTSAQIRAVGDSGIAVSTADLRTRGWIDRRGRDD